MEKSKIIQNATTAILSKDYNAAKSIISQQYPFQKAWRFKRKYTLKQMMQIFLRDQFTDRYTGNKLINPGVLKSISHYLPEEFPYHLHWKVDECHVAYWDLVPTVDHLVPIAAGGVDDESNWVTTNMLNNNIKSNWALEQLHWKVIPINELQKWDGLTSGLISLVDTDESLLQDSYIKKWYQVSIENLSI